MIQEPMTAELTAPVGKRDHSQRLGAGKTVEEAAMHQIGPRGERES